MTFTDSQNTHDFPLGQSSTAGETNATNEVSAEISQSRQLQQLEPPPPNGDDRGMSPSKESHVLDEDQLRVEEDASILQSSRSPAQVENAPEPSKRQPSGRPNTRTNSSSVEPVAGNPAVNLTRRGSSKRSFDFEHSNSRPRSSSRLRKRRKRSSEPVRASNNSVIPTNLITPGLYLPPEAVAKAEEDWRNISTAYKEDLSSRKETYEAALRRATRRANDAEHRLQDLDHIYADNLKALKVKESELQAEKEKNDSANLSEMIGRKEQPNFYDSLRAYLNPAIEKFEQVEVQHSAFTRLINAFVAQNFEDLSDENLLNEIKEYGTQMRDENEKMKKKVEEVMSMCRGTNEALSAAFHARFGAGSSQSLEPQSPLG